jgi:hypothetical protein
VNARATIVAGAMFLALAVAGCGKDAPKEIATSSIPGHDGLAQDTTHKEGPRLVPPEVYIRTYLSLFGGLSPIAAQTAAKGQDGTQLFDTWNEYLSSLGLPDYRIDIPRQTQTNTLMLATFERLGIALCDRALEKDLTGASPPPASQRLVFAFDTPAAIDEAAFAERFDVMHRTFLGYPAALAPESRIANFFTLYSDTVARHAAPDAGKSRFSPVHSGWAVVCYGLVRHPEFHLY